MTVDFISRNWSLLIAGVLATGIVLFLLFRVFSDSARGRLRSEVKRLNQCYKDYQRARKASDKAAERLATLEQKAASVKPRRIQEASEALEDARMLQKIAEDQVMIAENYVQKLIVDEFPPKQHSALRDKHLRRHAEDGKPFTF